MSKKYKILVGIGVTAYATQGIVMCAMWLTADKLLQKATYLASIVGKNVEHLDDFDLIALRELGLIEKTTED